MVCRFVWSIVRATCVGAALLTLTGSITNLTAAGQNASLLVGGGLPAATNVLGGLYVLCSPGGDNISVIPGVSCDEGDWFSALAKLTAGFISTPLAVGVEAEAPPRWRRCSTPRSPRRKQVSCCNTTAQECGSTQMLIQPKHWMIPDDVDTSGVSTGEVLAYDNGRKPVTAASLSVDVDLGYSAAPDKALSPTQRVTTLRSHWAMAPTPACRSTITPPLKKASWPVYARRGCHPRPQPYLQSGDNVSELINDADYITLADVPEVTGFVKLDDEGTEQEITGGGGLSVEGGITSEFGTNAAQLGNIAPLNDWSVYPARADQWLSTIPTGC